jgi:hypothetical protein
MEDRGPWRTAILACAPVSERLRILALVAGDPDTGPSAVPRYLLDALGRQFEVGGAAIRAAMRIPVSRAKFSATGFGGPRRWEAVLAPGPRGIVRRNRGGAQSNHSCGRL